MKTRHLVCSLFALLLFGQLVQAQDIITVKHSCSFDGEELDQDFYTFDASNEADKIVKQIVESVSLQKNFIVKSSDCKNALATTDNGKRYILYNTSFLEKFKADAKTQWAAYCVMAHEIGHHLNGHDFEVTDKRKRKSMELEADIFAGGVLYALGASLEEAKAGIELLQDNIPSDTHPPARARAEAIASGWKKKQELYKGRQSEELLRDGSQKSDDNDRKKEEEKTKIPPSKPKQKPDNFEDEKEPFVPAVSDQLMANTLVGTWTTSFYNNAGQLVTNNVALFNDYSMRAEAYINFVNVSTSIEQWTVYNGHFVETDAQGYYFKYRLDFYNNNSVNLTFVETNHPNPVVAYNTVFSYVRF